MSWGGCYDKEEGRGDVHGKSALLYHAFKNETGADKKTGPVSAWQWVAGGSVELGKDRGFHFLCQRQKSSFIIN
jgi:hypothetical protein